MADGSFFKSTPVRVSIIYIVLFMTAYLGANIVAARLVWNFLDARLDSIVLERYREIESAYSERGLLGAVSMINSHGPAIRGEETIYTLSTPSHIVLAGNAALINITPGSSSIDFLQEDGREISYKLFKGKLGNNDLVVGISSGGSDALARIVLVSLAWTTAIVFVIGLGGAAVLRYRTRRRITFLSQTAHAIGHGELSKRLPISARRDEIDVFSREINVALTRLEASVGVMKQVTTDIAHDLKTPISRTFLILDEALQAGTVEEAKGSIEVALSELRLISDTFEALLRIARIESRSRTSRFAAVDLKSLAREIFEVYEGTEIDGGHHLDISENGEPCVVDGDADLLRQMLANLVANAIQHTPPGTKISLAVANNRNTSCVSVADNGPGIPLEERSRVFDRFYRLEKSRTSAGTGLGLSLVRAISDLHDARIDLEDNSPGLAVHVCFPVADGSLGPR